ncbi:MAG: peptidylprolyl isomerase [Minwuia sp.]|uniref:peptidylprolyl isomerase n=1 Tax=Minwuia sp. TaxID=2493630 RepID=UPI003A84EB8B
MLRRLAKGVMRHLLAVLALALVMAGAASAQQVLGIAAVVDDEVISAYDLEERLDLVIASARLPATDETRRRLRPQVLRQLVDEELQKIAARDAGVKVLNSDIDDEIDSIAERNGLSGAQLLSELKRAGVDEHALRQQVLAGLAWQRFMAARLLRTVQVTDEEVDEAIRRRREAQGEKVYLVSEILLTVDDPSAERTVNDAAERLVRQIRAGARFDALARQFSSGATAAQGGDVGWVRADALGPEIESVLPEMRSGSVSEPIRTATGYTIIGLRETRVQGEESLGAVTVRLSQLLIPLGRDAAQDDVNRAGSVAADMRGLISSCDDVKPLAERLSIVEAADLGQLRIGDLPQSFRNAVGALKVGEVSPPIRTAAGMHLLVVCERDDPQEAALDRARIENEIVGRKLNQRALSYLRDLRRDTIVDYR